MTGTDPGHGNSLAAWFVAVTILVATTAGAIFLILDLHWGAVACAALAVLGVIGGGVLRMLGYGVDGAKTKHRSH